MKMSLRRQHRQAFIESGIFFDLVEPVHNGHRIASIGHHDMFTVFYLVQVIGQPILQFTNANSLHLFTSLFRCSYCSCMVNMLSIFPVFFFGKRFTTAITENSADHLKLDGYNQMQTKKQTRRHLLSLSRLFLTICLLFPAATASAGEILLSQVGNGQWQVSAAELKNVQALDLQLNYDPQRLSGLTVTAGAGLAGAMSAINDKTPGLIRLGVASTQPLPASGILLKLQSSTPGAELLVRAFTVKVVDGDGKVVPTTLRQQLPLAPSLPPTPTEIVTLPGEAQPLVVTPPPNLPFERGGT